MSVFALRDYQVNTLAALEAYLQKCVEYGSAKKAFVDITERPYVALEALGDLPYVCLRVPTGGGKTLIAAHSVARAADHYLYAETPVVLWLVPSTTIREQTLQSLRDRSHSNRQALAARFGENVRIMDVSEALYGKRADYDGGVVVIVATLAAFRVEETEGRKVYDANGELMDHFSGLDPALVEVLEKTVHGDVVPSFANVLRLRRPMVIIDEAHNARTELSFDTLARLAPSLILELTATPVTPKEHDPAKGRFASNILHSVSAAELKVAEMIKLPVVLRGWPDHKETIGFALATLDELHAVAMAEEKVTGEFIRPVMLIQAEAKSKDKFTLHAEEVKKLLIEDFNVPEAHIAIATGDSRGLDGVDLFNPDEQIRLIITQSALREGWDCSFAYVLCSVAEQKSGRAVEQLLGRVLRLPYAKRKRDERLNQAYAFATTNHFIAAANALKDGLVSNGFEKVEAETLVRTPAQTLKGFESGGDAYVHGETLPVDIDLEDLKAKVEIATGKRVWIDAETRKIHTRGALSDYDRTTLELTLPAVAKGAITALVHKSRGANLAVVAEGAAVRFAVPQLVVRSERGLELFDRNHFLDTPWKLEGYDPSAILNHFLPPEGRGDGAKLDVGTDQKVRIEYLHNQLNLNLSERGWTRPALINWFDRRLPKNHRGDITRTSATLFIAKALDLVEAHYRVSLEVIAKNKFRLLEALVKAIADLRDKRQSEAFQGALFEQGGLDIATSSDIELVFDESRYGYNRPYKGGTVFQKHLFRVVGDLEPEGEEFDCAVHLDRHPKVKTWVRNTVSKSSLRFQTSKDWFYPDFVALLEDERVMGIEYKGAHLYEGAKEKKLIGDLWADRSAGKCLFLMIQDRQFAQIDKAMAG